MFWCGGCSTAHQIVDGTWTFNGDLERPTFHPSVLVRGGPDDLVCHSFVTDGRIQYLGDSTHHLAGQTVDLPAWPPAPLCPECAQGKCVNCTGDVLTEEDVLEPCRHRADKVHP